MLFSRKRKFEKYLKNLKVAVKYLEEKEEF